MNAEDSPHKVLDSKSVTKASSSSLLKEVKQDGGNTSESSQSIVDELFKDFFSKKISRNNKSGNGKDASRPDKVDEISKLLDMEISSIQAQTKDSLVKEKTDAQICENPVKDKTKSDASVPAPGGQLSLTTSESSSASGKLPSGSNDAKNGPTHKITANIPLPPPVTSDANVQKIPEKSQPPENFISIPAASLSNSSSTTSKSFNSSTNALISVSSSVPAGVAKPDGLSAKKMLIPKQLGCMLTSESLSLIKSNERIDKNNRVWEDGEVASSHSGASAKEDSDTDDAGYPSETGSINSDQGNWTSHSSSKHKKKHKHKHKKKKKKKSSKEKSKSGEDEKEKKKEKDKDKDDVRDREKVNSSSEAKENENEKHRDREEERKGEKTGEEEIEKGKSKGNESESSKDKKTSDKDKSDSKKKDKEKKRKRDRSRSRTPKKSKSSKSRSRSPRRPKRSPSPRRSRYNEWDARSYGDDPKKSHKDPSYRSRSPSRRKRSSERKRERSKERNNDLRLQIDKAKLRKIAIANTLNNMKSGQQMAVAAQMDMAAVKSGGKSVEELTDFCKRISEKEQEKQDQAVSDSSDEEPGKGQSDEDEPLIHHPFKVKDATSNIIMNIRNAKQLPVMTPSEKQAQQATLRLAFPVSSGSHHRAKESEWVPVERTTAQATTTTNKASVAQAPLEPQPAPSQSIFPETQKVDIGAIISERLQAVRKLQTNPYDVQALSSMHRAQEKASQWAQSKHLPGQFTGSTGAQVMSQQELMGDKRHQAWAKKVDSQGSSLVITGQGRIPVY